MRDSTHRRIISKRGLRWKGAGTIKDMLKHHKTKLG